mmetsp:Transcript_4521/g.10560  ORF Transcript_4521/g.10560 Transcript_4521/m.10560 type:complete len:791 (+) Transcript_4521:39-2411(+)
MGVQLSSWHPRVHYAVCGGLGILLLIFRCGDEVSDGPARISQRQLTSEEGVAADLPVNVRSAMRGFSGAAVDFRWFFVDDAAEGVPAGTVFRTRLVALDAQGRLAKCGGLRVNASVGGHARLAAGMLDHWVHSELNLDIEDQKAEEVDVEVRIERPPHGPLSYQSKVRFTTEAPRGLRLGLHPLALSAMNRSGRSFSQWSGDPATNGTRWPTLVVHEVVLQAFDANGNVLPAEDAGVSCSRYRLRSNSRSLEILTPGGQFSMNQLGEVAVMIRASSAGKISLWLESAAGETSLPGHALLQVEFADPPSSYPPRTGGSLTHNATSDKWQVLAGEVRKAFLHAWSGYKRYAWGADELKPVSLQGKDTFGNIGMTIIDSLTTLWLMDLQSEFDEGQAFVEKELDFDTADREISVFEVVIRALGGLLGAHSLSGRQIFLDRAIELAERLLPAMNTSSGLPLPRWNLARGRGKSTYDPKKEPTILAEAGSFQLEFRYLAAVTGDLRYSHAADVATSAIRAAGANGLVPVHLSPAEGGPPRLMPDRLAMGALADSYYEYLLKQWLQSPAEKLHRDAWLAVMDALPSLVVPDPRKEGSTGKLQLTELSSHGDRIWKMDHLSCFVPGMVALGLQTIPEEELLKNGRNETWHRMAEGLTSTCAHLWLDTKTGLAPEFVYLNKQGDGTTSLPRGASHSFLRPETAESLFYLYRTTGHLRYRKWGKKLFHAIVEHSKVDGGYGSVQDVNVVPTQKMDEMQSFVMAETFKYLFLLFSPAEAFDLDRYVLNTEGHPLRKLAPW